MSEGSTTEIEPEFEHLAHYERFRDHDVFVASLLYGLPSVRADLFPAIAHYRVVWRFPFGPETLVGLWTGPHVLETWDMLICHRHQMLLPFTFESAYTLSHAVELFQQHRGAQGIPHEYSMKYIFARNLSPEEIRHWELAEFRRPRMHVTFQHFGARHTFVDLFPEEFRVLL